MINGETLEVPTDGPEPPPSLAGRRDFDDNGSDNAGWLMWILCLLGERKRQLGLNLI